MVDFAICSSEHKEKEDCPKRDSCQRYLWYVDKKSWSGWQSHMGTKFIKELNKVSCDYYMEKWK